MDMLPGHRSRPTLAQVARAAGVSVPTVSKVLNGRRDVSPSTRARVEVCLGDLGYVGPHGPARKTERQLIELVFDEFGNPNTLEVARGAVEAARQNDIDIIINVTPATALRTTTSNAMRVGTIVVMPRVHQREWLKFHDAGVPMLFIDPHLSHEGVTTIAATNFDGGHAATQHLVDLGHERVAIITGRADSVGSRARLDGFVAAMDAAGLDPERQTREGDFTYELAFRHAMELLQLPDRPTAVFASSDLQAFAVMEAARLVGLSVPHDLSVVGFDDMSLAACAAPALTTVHQPYAEMAGLAVRRMLNECRGDGPDAEHIELPTDFLVRQSTAAPLSA